MKVNRPIYGNESTVHGSCGLSVVYGFRGESPEDQRWRDTILRPEAYGTGFYIAAFVDTEVCRDTYTMLSKKHKIVYQSPVRRNRNSGRGFFFCVFDKRSK